MADPTQPGPTSQGHDGLPGGHLPSSIPRRNSRPGLWPPFEPKSSGASLPEGQPTGPGMSTSLGVASDYSTHPPPPRDSTSSPISRRCSPPPSDLSSGSFRSFPSPCASDAGGSHRRNVSTQSANLRTPSPKRARLYRARPHPDSEAKQSMSEMVGWVNAVDLPTNESRVRGQDTGQPCPERNHRKLDFYRAYGRLQLVVDYCEAQLSTCKCLNCTKETAHLECTALESWLELADFKTILDKTSVWSTFADATTNTSDEQILENPSASIHQLTSRAFACFAINDLQSARHCTSILDKISTGNLPIFYRHKRDMLAALAFASTNSLNAAKVAIFLAMEQNNVPKWEARVEFDPSIGACRRELPPSSLPQQELDMMLGDLHLRHGETLLAAAYYGTSYSTIKPIWGSANSKTLRAASKYALVTSIRGHAKKMIPFAVETCDSQMRALGDKHPDVTFSQAVLLLAFAAVDSFDSALYRLSRVTKHARLPNGVVLDSDILGPISAILRNRTRLKRDINGHVSEECFLRLFQMQCPNPTAFNASNDVPGATNNDTFLRPFASLKYSEHSAVATIYFSACRGDASAIEKTLSGMEKLPSLGWYGRLLRACLSRAITYNNPAVVSALHKHLHEAAKQERSWASLLISDALLMAAENGSPTSIGLLLRPPQAEFSELLNRRNIIDALNILVLSRASESIRALLIDHALVLEAFDFVLREAVRRRRLADLKTLVEHMHSSWRYANHKGVKNGNELLAYHKETGSWEAVRQWLEDDISDHMHG